jgi:hypothetical protein
MDLMDVDLDLGDGLLLRVLGAADATVLAEATSGEPGPALWGPRPVGPYSLRDAQAALAAWDPAAGGQFCLVSQLAARSAARAWASSPATMAAEKEVPLHSAKPFPSPAGPVSGMRLTTVPGRHLRTQGPWLL